MLLSGKQIPELYFDEEIKNGISSLSFLAKRSEVQRGLSQLREDIDSGEVWEIIENYDNDLGDYLYVIAEKAR